MTLDEEKNMTFTKDSTTYAGFATEYHKAIEEGIRSGVKEIPLEPSYKPYGETELMVWQLKVTEGNQPGRYNFNGFQATLMQEGKDPITQFIPNFKMTGMKAEDSYAALKGSTVLHAEWDNNLKKRKYVFSKFDLSQPAAPGENYPVIRINANDVEIARLLSKEDIVGTTEDKTKYLANLQTGNKFPVKVRETVNGALRYPTVFLQLNLMDANNMGMRVTNAEGKVLRNHSVESKQQEMTQTVGLLLGKDNQAKLPQGLVKMLEKAKQAGPRIGSRGRNIA